MVEHPLLPLYLKETIARILFDNLQVRLPSYSRLHDCNESFKVPSISFASSHLLSLFAVGKITGLVLDCGHLESTALPVSPYMAIGSVVLRAFYRADFRSPSSFPSSANHAIGWFSASISSPCSSTPLWDLPSSSYIPQRCRKHTCLQSVYTGARGSFNRCCDRRN